MQDVRWRFWWLLSGDGFHRVDNVPKPISAGALHRTQWGAYSAIQTPSWWGKGLPQEHYPSAHRATLPPPGNTPPPNMNPSYGLGNGLILLSLSVGYNTLCSQATRTKNNN